MHMLAHIYIHIFLRGRLVFIKGGHYDLKAQETKVNYVKIFRIHLIFSYVCVRGVCVSVVVGESCKGIIGASAAGVMGGYEMPHVRPGMEILLSLLPSSNIIFENYLIFYNQFLKKQ